MCNMTLKKRVLGVHRHRLTALFRLSFSPKRYCNVMTTIGGSCADQWAVFASSWSMNFFVSLRFRFSTFFFVSLLMNQKADKEEWTKEVLSFIEKLYTWWWYQRREAIINHFFLFATTSRIAGFLGIFNPHPPPQSVFCSEVDDSFVSDHLGITQKPRPTMFDQTQNRRISLLRLSLLFSDLSPQLTLTRWVLLPSMLPHVCEGKHSQSCGMKILLHKNYRALNLPRDGKEKEKSEATTTGWWSRECGAYSI